MNVIGTIVALLLHAIACFGWGRGLERSVQLQHDNAAVSVALGLACTLTLGGFCNLLGVAYAEALWVITGVGVLLVLPWLRSAARLDGVTIAVVCCALLVCVLVVCTLVPPWAFNFHDDYQKYFVHPARMLQTGSLRGSSASALGFETLGGQAFLHGFVLSLTSFDALNAVDLGFGWPLCIALAGLGACSDAWQVGARALAVLCVLTLNPQVVNISATYTASALALAWVELGRSQTLARRDQVRAFACASGVLFAGLCALKSTFLLLCLALYGFSCLALWLHFGLRRAVQWASPTLGVWLFALLPWLALHAPLFLAPGTAARPRVLDTLAVPFELDLLSLEPELYGGDCFAIYTFAASVCALVAIYAWQLAPRTAAGMRSWPSQLALIVALSLAFCYVSMLYVVAPRSQGAVTLLRLCAPLFIALAPASIALAAQLTQSAGTLTRSALLVFALALCSPFLRGLATRVDSAINFGSLLAFPKLAHDEDYIRYNYEVLYGSEARRTARAQAAVPAGEPLIAMINTPFWLDFKRNRIADIDPAGLATPWANMPRASYLLWDFAGYATVSPRGYELERDRPGLLQARVGDAGLRLMRVLAQLARTSRVLYNDGHTMVLQLSAASTLADAYGATAPTRD